MRIYWFFIWRNLNPYHPRMLVRRLIEIDSVVLEKKIFKFRLCIFSIKNYLPLEKDGALHLNKLESPLKDALCQVWLKLAQWFWRRRFFNFVNVFSLIFVIISPWKRAGSIIWTNLNHLHPRMLCPFQLRWAKNWQTTKIGPTNFNDSTVLLNQRRHILHSPRVPPRGIHGRFLKLPQYHKQLIQDGPVCHIKSFKQKY